MTEPFYSSLLGKARLTARATRFKELRNMALKIERYGRGNKNIDKFGNRFLKDVIEKTEAVFTDVEPGSPMA